MRSLQAIRKGLWPAPLAIVFMIMAAGCSREGTAPVSPGPGTSPQVSLEAPDGGFTSSPESPAFGDPALQNLAADEVQVTDPLANDPQLRDLSNGLARVHSLTVIWGLVRGIDSTGSGVAGDGVDFDWTGKISVSRGAVLVNSLVSFEEGEGDALLPRVLRTEVGWISHTGTGVDGIRVRIVQQPQLGGGRDSVTITAGPYTGTFAFSELSDLNLYVPIDDRGHGVTIQSFTVDPTAATESGFVQGRWNAISPGDRYGYFQGLWLGERGRVDGFYRGIYGTRADGSRAFFGKITDNSGRFRGILRGTWDQAPGSIGGASVQSGSFRGQWEDERGGRLGSLSGDWRATERGPGRMQGIWRQGSAS